jgi:hypothetical protein
MKIILSLLLIALVGVSTVRAHVTDSDERQIQGTWRLEGSSGGHSWFLEWTFAEGRFTLKGYPPLFQEGSYRITKTGAGRLTLALYDQKGNFGTENSEIEIVIDTRKDKLKIKGQGPFSRVKSHNQS